MALRYTDYYEVDASGDGMLPCGTPISTYHVENNFPPLDISHPNILHIFFTNYTKKEVVCARRGSTLNEWLEISGKPLNDYSISADKEKDQAASEKEEEKIKAFSLSPQLRNFVGGMLRAVCYVHKKGYAMQELSEDNICILDGELKFWKLNFVNQSVESKNENFRGIADIISRILELNLSCECPPDVTNLLNLLRSDSAAMRNEKILCHIATLSPEMRLTLVVEMFGMGRCMETEDNWKAAATVFFVKADLNDWKVKHEKKMSGYVLECYNFRNNSIPYTVKLSGDGRVQEVDVVNSFLNFLRNIAYHLGDEKGKRRRLKKEAVDAILFWAFGDEIILFMECLDQLGVRPMLPVHHFLP